MINDDVAKVKDVLLIVLRLRDLIEWRIWQPDYLEFTAEYLSTPWKIQRQKGTCKEKSRRKRRDPGTFGLRKKLSRRKYRLKAAQKLIRKDFKKRGMKVLTAAKYDHMLKQVKDKDKQFEQKQILNWVPPKGHTAQYNRLKAQVIK